MPSIVALTPDAEQRIDPAALLLLDAFLGRTDDWQTRELARDEVRASLAPDRLSFHVRLGFVVAGVLPDANGRGKPDIFLAKRVSPGR